ncbi:hypothetical protein CC78DRAFT_530185 [Lojkania enalia]|uniref:Uncharacterized protein n=1 Tax=Lojkania enalia TaxID=147567 RepID=A0A9P4KJG5_9PLEO|nr:hypothetical protein CC78DRAFT_530185 [Didymosphaeria enalia]
MKFSTAILLASASLAAAAPLEGKEARRDVLIADGPGNSTSEVTVAKRVKDSSNCGLQMYQQFGQKAFMHILFWLTGRQTYNKKGEEVPDVIIVTPGKEKMFACEGHVGFYINVDKTGDDKYDRIDRPFSPADLGWTMDATFHDCYGGPPADDDNPINAIQHFSSDGWNVLVRGNCDL